MTYQQYRHYMNRFARHFSVDKASRSYTNPLWQRYNDALSKSPLLTKSITAGVIAFTADIICQTYFPTSIEDLQKPISDRINWRRTANFTVLNIFVVAPSLHYWYSFLATRVVGTGFLPTIKRVALDQAIFAPFIVHVILAGNLLLEGKADLIPEKLRADGFSTLLANYSLWIPAQLINFRFVPPQFQVLWANFVGFFWNLYLSNAANKKIGDQAKE